MKNKNDKIIMECYVLLYKNSTPSADFNKLVEYANTNEFGQKHIDFMSYEIDEDKFETIINGVFKKYKLTKYESKKFREYIYLGCSPKIKQKL